VIVGRCVNMNVERHRPNQATQKYCLV